jgi:tetratricopeptide (TPR) repeat protein
MPAPSEIGFWSHLQRGMMLRQTGRFALAENSLQQAIGLEPNNPLGYYQLAFCYCNWDGHAKKALATVDRAIALQPNHADSHALRAWILGNLNRHKDAIKTAEQALALDPHDLLAWNARTRAWCSQHKWREMETSARATLAVDPENDLAANFLAIALRHLGRRAESEQVVAQILARVPDDPIAQTNAGWSALEAGDHRRANEHFLTALRLDPHYEYARTGLLHSFNARVWFYRLYFRIVTAIGKMQVVGRYLTVIFIYIIYRIVVTQLEHQGRYGREAALVIVGYYILLLVFPRSFGNLFLLLDRFARHALTRKEKAWSAVAGLFYGLLLFAAYADQFWIPLALLLVPPACYLWSIFLPADRFLPQAAEPAPVG